MLPNDIKALLISDAETEEAAVALNVGVGSYSDPDYLPGLAHFLEHMLFMGSEKYPDMDDFPNLIALNTGIFNAFTNPENTNFHFQIAHGGLEKTMEVFANFFINPLLLSDTVDKER